jgi:chromosome segregation ATPase
MSLPTAEARPAGADQPSQGPATLERAVLVRLAQQLHDLCRRHLRQMAEAEEELRQGFASIRQEQEQLQRQKQEHNRRWHRRWQQEWEHIWQRQQQVEKERDVLETASRQLRQQWAVQQQRLEEGWRQLHLARQAWQEKLAREQAECRQLRQDLLEQQRTWEAQRQALQEQVVQMQAVLARLEQERLRLETRIRHCYQKLDQLREEAARCESVLAVAAARQVSPTSGGTAEQVSADSPALVPVPRLLLEGLAQVVTTLLDESQRLLETQQQMQAARQTLEQLWQQTADALGQGQADLDRRLAQVREREADLARQEQAVHRRLAQLAHQEQELQTREIDLAYQRRKLARRQARWQELLQAQLRLARQRLQEAARIRAAGGATPASQPEAEELLRPDLLELEQELATLRIQHRHLLARLKEQEEQIEHLTLHLLEGPDQPPALSAAA